VYGVVTHVVGQRTRELAVRMALGARPSEVMRMILRKAVLLSAAGATIGVVLSLASVRAIEGFLYGVSPLDWPSFAGAAIFAIGLGVSAALWPALRATNVDPAVLLRTG
jgi:ABC-type antimicrobial peptide transport system permease subunit